MRRPPPHFPPSSRTQHPLPSPHLLLRRIRHKAILLLHPCALARHTPLNGRIQPDLGVDGGNTLTVRGGNAAAPEDEVHFLERELLGLGDVEPDEGGAEGDEAAEEDEGAPGHFLEHVRGHLADYEVVHLWKSC